VVNRSRVRQLVAAGKLPFEQTPHGYAFRREQLLTVANARRARFHAYAAESAERPSGQQGDQLLAVHTDESDRN
jgi:hypothetical protein